jgi:hypothetical protein
MHTMLTLQLDSYEADGTLLQRNTLSFVELAAPEPKVWYTSSHSNTFQQVRSTKKVSAQRQLYSAVMPPMGCMQV